jgi:hypothetical protein
MVDMESDDLEPGVTAAIDSRLGAFDKLCNHPVFVTEAQAPVETRLGIDEHHD